MVRGRRSMNGDALVKLISSLTPRQGIALSMQRFDRLSHCEIARRCGVGTRAIESRLRRARQSLGRLGINLPHVRRG